MVYFFMAESAANDAAVISRRFILLFFGGSSLSSKLETLRKPPSLRNSLGLCRAALKSPISHSPSSSSPDRPVPAAQPGAGGSSPYFRWRTGPSSPSSP